MADLAAAPNIGPGGGGGIAGRAIDQLVKSSTWPADHVSRFSKRGIVPIGTPVLHSPTNAVAVITNELGSFGLHMISAMRDADGIGLAANQVGVPLQVLVHKFGWIAPRVLVNPELLSSSGWWDYHEGCLSLKMDGTDALVRRPKVVLVRAGTIDGGGIIVSADELFARVLLHEIDHLNGIEYVQRLTGDDRDRVYEVIASHGIDVACIPPSPYEVAGRGSVA